MVELKLARLPDRTPVKMAITVPPELNRALLEYAETYRATYGEAESVAELIPYMLDAFLESDRGFAKARKDGAAGPASPPPDRSPRLQRHDSAAPLSTTSTEG